MANAQREEAEEHKKNIENAFITIGIIGFLILFLLLSRSIIVNEKWVTSKMVEKNKRIRIAAAKKTIEQLGEQIDISKGV